MTEQLSMFDLPGLNEPPELWECMKTCVHVGGPLDDFFPGKNIPRCNYPISVYGTSGKGCCQEVRNNLVHMWCTLYEKREGSKT